MSWYWTIASSRFWSYSKLHLQSKLQLCFIISKMLMLHANMYLIKYSYAISNAWFKYYVPITDISLLTSEYVQKQNADIKTLQTLLTFVSMVRGFSILSQNTLTRPVSMACMAEVVIFKPGSNVVFCVCRIQFALYSAKLKQNSTPVSNVEFCMYLIQ